MISAISGSLVQSFRPPAIPLAARGADSVQPKGPESGDAGRLGELTEEQKKQVDQLKKTDREVRAHEQAHKNAGGQFAGSASFGYTVGPDGRRYAVSGEVPIDIAPVEGDPAATISKMNIVASAALAPAKPSGQDRKVAALATSIRADAQAELTVKSRDRLSGKEDGEGDSKTSALSAQAAYTTGSAPEKGSQISGSLLDLFS
ncbi:MAG: hypothetical protein GXP00_05895 [Alphaproteobacteria bacterium]|nr:hypothetical protein [Alphaproteobacteria bacterium]